MMLFRSATQSDLLSIESLLADASLPFDDWENHLSQFIVLELDKRIIAVGGLEVYDQIALLRSIVVSSEYQGQGLGGKVAHHLTQNALNLGVVDLYLLTETATTYFMRQGFQVIDRATVPDAIRQTQQFSGLCPSTADLMHLHIG